MTERWQYKTVSIPPSQSSEDLDQILNRHGEAGWELVSLVVDAWQPRGFMGGGQQATYRAVFKAPA
jgi:hypothetical protein